MKRVSILSGRMLNKIPEKSRLNEQDEREVDVPCHRVLAWNSSVLCGIILCTNLRSVPKSRYQYNDCIWTDPTSDKYKVYVTLQSLNRVHVLLLAELRTSVTSTVPCRVGRKQEQSEIS